MNLDVFKRLRKRLKKGSEAERCVENAERMRLEREAIRAKAKTERRKEQRQTDTAFDEVEEQTCEVTGLFKPRTGLDGSKKTVQDLAEEAYEDEQAERESEAADRALKEFANGRKNGA